ncbi:MAG: hypothetical protein J5642_05485 [Bacteroidales bacterium]|nr:hypothetical protein [Bacteroidales bacterium]
MKRHIIFILLAICTLHIFAQKVSPNRAYNLFYEKEYAKAKECIDQCLTDEKFSTKASTWLYKANIEYQLAYADYSARQQDKNYQSLFPQAPQESYDAFKRAQELNKNIEATDMFAPYEALPILYTLLFIEGVDHLVAQQYETARVALEKAVESYEMQPPKYPLKGELYYYYAYTLSQLKEDTKAELYYKKAIEDGSENINVYIGLIETYKKADQPQEAIKLITKGIQQDPNNAYLRVAEADYYYWTGNSAEGRKKLNALPPTVASSPEAAINAANLYLKDSLYKEAESLLVRAYAIHPENGIIAHNLGVCCSHIGEEKYLESDKIKLTGDKAVSSALLEESKQYLSRSAEYFEKALLSSPDDTNVLFRLQQIYTRLDQKEKAEAVKAKLQKLEK